MSRSFQGSAKRPLPADLQPFWLSSLVAEHAVLCLTAFALPSVLCLSMWQYYPVVFRAGLDGFRVENHPITTLHDQWQSISHLSFGDGATHRPANGLNSDELSLNRERTQVDPRLQLKLIYTASSGGEILTSNHLHLIREVERRVVDWRGYRTFCLLNSTTATCKPPDSIINYFFPSVLDNGRVFQFDGNGESMVDVEQGTNILLLAARYGFLDRSFGLNYLNSTSIQTTFKFALPLAGYRDQHDRQAEQVAAVFAHIRSYRPLLEKLAESNGIVQLSYTGGPLDYDQIDEAVNHDLILAGVSVSIVLLYMWCVTRSLSLSIAAVLQILLSVPLGYFMFRFVLFGSQAHIITLVSIWLLLGIGADQAFVILGTWRSSPKYTRSNRRLAAEERLAWTYRQAGFGVLVTAIATGAAFIGAAVVARVQQVRVGIAEHPLVYFLMRCMQQLGFFMASLMACNLVLVIFWFPAAIVLHERRLNLRKVPRKDIVNKWRTVSRRAVAHDRQIQQNSDLFYFEKPNYSFSDLFEAVRLRRRPAASIADMRRTAPGISRKEQHTSFELKIARKENSNSFFGWWFYALFRLRHLVLGISFWLLFTAYLRMDQLEPREQQKIEQILASKLHNVERARYLQGHVLQNCDGCTYDELNARREAPLLSDLPSVGEGFPIPIPPLEGYSIRLAVPDKPENVSALRLGLTEFRVSWEAPRFSGSSSISKYVLIVGALSTGQWHVHDDIDAVSAAADIDDLDYDEHYSIRLVAQNAAGYSFPSPALLIQTYPQLPRAPENLTINGTSHTGTIAISWNSWSSFYVDVNYDMIIRIEKHIDLPSIGRDLLVELGGESSYSIANGNVLGACGRDVLSFMVRSKLYDYVSEWSDLVSIELNSAVPDAVGNLKLLSGDSIPVRLEIPLPNCSNGADIVSLEVIVNDELLESIEDLNTFNVSSVVWIHDDAALGSMYKYSVSARNAFGLGPSSRTLRVRPTTLPAPFNLKLSVSRLDPNADNSSYLVDGLIDWEFDFDALPEGSSPVFTVEQLNISNPQAQWRELLKNTEETSFFFNNAFFPAAGVKLRVGAFGGLWTEQEFFPGQLSNESSDPIALDATISVHAFHSTQNLFQVSLQDTWPIFFDDEKMWPLSRQYTVRKINLSGIVTIALNRTTGPSWVTIPNWPVGGLSVEPSIDKRFELVIDAPPQLNGQTSRRYIFSLYFELEDQLTGSVVIQPMQVVIIAMNTSHVYDSSIPASPALSAAAMETASMRVWWNPDAEAWTVIEIRVGADGNSNETTESEIWTVACTGFIMECIIVELLPGKTYDLRSRACVSEFGCSVPWAGLSVTTAEAIDVDSVAINVTSVMSKNPRLVNRVSIDLAIFIGATNGACSDAVYAVTPAGIIRAMITNTICVDNASQALQVVFDGISLASDESTKLVIHFQSASGLSNRATVSFLEASAWWCETCNGRGNCLVNGTFELRANSSIHSTEGLWWSPDATCVNCVASFGDQCQHACPGLTIKSAPCSGHGLCTADGMCECYAGYGGYNCSTCADEFRGDDCSLECPIGDDGTVCSSNGNCIAAQIKADTGHIQSEMAICQCLDGFGGESCQLECDCSGRGTCSTDRDRCTSCDLGFSGTKCQLECPRSEFDESVCSNHGTCLFTVDSSDGYTEIAECKCNEGWLGNFCDVECPTTSMDSSVANVTGVCSGAGTCRLHKNGTAYCECDFYHEGERCNILRAPPPPDRNALPATLSVVIDLVWTVIAPSHSPGATLKTIVEGVSQRGPEEIHYFDLAPQQDFVTRIDSQLYLVEMCNRLFNFTEIRAGSRCMWPAFATFVNASTPDVYPVASAPAFTSHLVKFLSSIAGRMYEDDVGWACNDTNYSSISVSQCTSVRILWVRAVIVTDWRTDATTKTLEQAFRQWEGWIDNEKKNFANPWPMMYQTAPEWVRLVVEQALVSSAVDMCAVGILVSVCVVLFLTGSLAVALLVALCTTCILLGLVGVFVTYRLAVGPVETATLAFLVGLSVDLSLRVAQAYRTANHVDRFSKAKVAMERSGKTVLAAAASIVCSCVLLILAQLRQLRLFGLLVAISGITSAALCLVTLVALLIVAGPQGRISRHFLTPVVARFRKWRDERKLRESNVTESRTRTSFSSFNLQQPQHFERYQFNKSQNLEG